MKKFNNSIVPITIVMFSIIAFSGCEDDPEPPGDFEFRFRVNPHWDNGEFALFQDYLNVSGYNVNFEAFKFYLSNIVLVKNNGDEVELSEIEFFDMEDNSLTKKFKIPEGNYKGIKFGWGVPVELNGTQDENFDPTIYGADHPLYLDNNMYWAWASGYRFLIFDGRYDTTPSTTNDLPEPFSIHTGHDEVYREIENLNVPFSFDNQSNMRFTMNLDMARSFYSASDTINLALPEDNQAHVNNIQLHHRLMDNIIEASSFEVQ